VVQHKILPWQKQHCAFGLEPLALHMDA
jgi:hypothetical protein